MVKRVENLSLDGVEVSKLVEALILPVPQGCHWQRLQVEQL